MAELHIKPLASRLDEQQIAALSRALEGVKAPALPRGGRAGLTFADELDEEVLDEMLELLESRDAACDIYLPVAFEGRVSVGDLAVGSASGLLRALAELREELEFDQDYDEEEDLDGTGVELSHLRELWKLIHDGATEALDRSLPLYLVP